MEMYYKYSPIRNANIRDLGKLGDYMFDFCQEIERLIELRQEGSYWDFKRQWYDIEHNSDLLHDIICMANNLENRDAFIIIGVDEENNYALKDVTDDMNRKNTQKLVDFLKDKKFMGDVRPTVLVREVQICKTTLDVIVVKNSNYTPFYLKEKYQSVNPNNIYTRIQDTNTPKNKSADIDKTEYLWRKRFGLIQTPLEKLEIFLKDPDNWVDGPYGEMDKYYKLFPEYTIRYNFDDSRNGYEYYFFFQTDTTPKFLSMRLSYHQTLLIEFVGLSLDGGRYVTPCPKTDGIAFQQSLHWDIMFKYMEKDSFLYTFNKFLYENEISGDATVARRKFIESILIFKNKQERLDFKLYVKNHWEEDKEKYISEIHVPCIPQLDGYKKNAFKEECENILILQKMLIDYRNLV